MRVLQLGLVSLGVSLLAGCGGLSQGATSAGDADEASATLADVDPYVAFTQAVTAVEPLIDPNLEAITADTLSRSDPSLNAQTAIQLPEVTPLEVRDDLVMVTSPELLSLNESLYQRFVQSGYSGVMDLNAMNASTAIQRFCQPQGIDLLTINRPMTPAEMASCQAAGRQPVSFPLGKDALLLVVNQPDTFVRRVTLETLRAILTRETWSAVNANWPNEPIERGLIGPDSAAIALLAETLFAANTTPLLNAPNTTLYDYAEPMAQALSLTPYSVGVVNYSTYQQLPQIFRAVPLNGISASFETVERGSYPLRQTSYLYADRLEMGARSPISAVVNFYLTYANEAISEVGLIPLTPPELTASKVQWLEIMGLGQASSEPVDSANTETPVGTISTGQNPSN